MMILDNLSTLCCFIESSRTGMRYGTPNCHLGANTGLCILPGNTSDKQIRYITLDDYVSDAITNVQDCLAEANTQLCTKISTSMIIRYRPVLDTTDTNWFIHSEPTLPCLENQGCLDNVVVWVSWQDYLDTSATWQQSQHISF